MEKNQNRGITAGARERRDCWSELQKCIRYVYRNAVSQSPSVTYSEQIPQEITSCIKDLMDRLWQEDWQQLLIRLEVLVRDFVIEAREHLKELHGVDDLPVRYLKGLLASYGAFCVAAENLAPYVQHLDKLLMKRFTVSFELLNKYLFQSCLYSNSFIQNNIPLYISQTQYSNQELIHSYLVFDEEMTDIASRWLDVKKLILKFSKKRTLSNKKGVMLLEDWEAYREHREIAANKTWCVRDKKQLRWDSSEFDVQLLSLIDDITSRIPELEVESNPSNGCKSCKHCSAPISCTCDDCTIKHILTCGLDTPPASPVDNTPSASASAPAPAPAPAPASHSLNHSQLLHHLTASVKKCNGESKKETCVASSKYKNLKVKTCQTNCNSHQPSAFPLIPGYQVTCPSQKVGSTVGGAVGSRPIKSTGSLLKLVTDKGFGPSCRAGTAVAAAAAAIVHHQNTTCDTAAAHNAHCNVDHNTTSKVPVEKTGGQNKDTAVGKKDDSFKKSNKTGNSNINSLESKKGSEQKGAHNMNTKAVLSSENMKNKCSRKENICSNRPCTISNCDHKRQKSLIYKKKLPKLCCEDDKCNCWTITNSKINSGNPSAESQSTGDGSSVDDGEAKRQRKIPIGRSCNGGEHCCRKHLMPASAPCDHEQKPGCGAAGDQPQQQPATGVGVPPLTNHQSLKHCDCTHADSFEPFNIHVNSKFNRLRDRLRHRLNEKRCSQLRKDTCDTAKEGPIDVGLDNVPVPPENVCNNKTEKKVKGSRQRPPQSVFSLTAESGGAGVHATAVDTRDIQDLLEFIEGTDKVTRLAEQHKRELKRLKKERKKEEKRLLAEQELLRKQEEEKLLKQLQEAKLKEEARLKRLEEQSKKDSKKSKSKKSNNPDNVNNKEKNSTGQKSKESESGRRELKEGGKPGPIVTIKRVMEGGSKEPTVTITLKGSTPDKDKLLYTLINGQSESGGNMADAKIEHANKGPLSKKQRKKLKKEQNKNQSGQNPVSNDSKKSKDSNKNRTMKTEQHNNSKKGKSAHEETAVKDSGSSRVCVQSAGNGNAEQEATGPGLHFQMLRLPPGITITKVEGPTVARKLNISSSASNASDRSVTGAGGRMGRVTTGPGAVSVGCSAPAAPTAVSAPAVLQAGDARAGIIVVDTIKLKQQTPAPQSDRLTPTLLHEPEKNATPRSKKNKKKKNRKVENIESNGAQKPYSQNDQLNIDHNSNGVLTLKNPMFYQVQEAVGEKIETSKAFQKVQQMQQGNNQQASIIKGANGMVTIRSPRLSSVNGPGAAAPAGGRGVGLPFMSLQPVGIGAPTSAPVLSELKPVVGPNTCYNSSAYKIPESKKPFNAQEILSGLPGIEITKINKNSIKSKSDTKKLFQPADVSIIPTNMPNGSNGDIYKLFYDNSDWSLESVFAPKDIKEDEVLDAEELELEAFKRFCQQSVPPERKEKVAYLNVKDIILKKKIS